MKIEDEIGKGTIMVKTVEELNEIAEKFNWQVVSPGGAANMLGVSRAYIHQLEKNGLIRAYRMDSNFNKKGISKIIQLLINTNRKFYIYIPVEDIEKIKAERKKTKGKK
jgi:hypothetical protein